VGVGQKMRCVIISEAFDKKDRKAASTLVVWDRFLYVFGENLPSARL
jgi:hypothetical protein